MPWSEKYEELISRVSSTIVTASLSRPKLEAAMIICDISARVLEEVFPDSDERLVALGSFMTRLGNVMDGKGRKN